MSAPDHPGAPHDEGGSALPEHRAERPTLDHARVVELDLPTVAELIRAKRARLQHFASLSRAPRSVRGQLSPADWRTMTRDQRAAHIATLTVDRMLDAVDEVRDRRALQP